MTRRGQDQLSKRLLARVLRGSGAVTVADEITSEVQEVDLRFTPTRGPIRPELGLLGVLASVPCLLEPYGGGLQPEDIRGCLHKQLALHEQALRALRRETGRRRGPPPLRVVVIAASVSSTLRAMFGAVPADAGMLGQCWPGVFSLPPGFATLIVSAGELPRGPQTLWPRLLVRGATQAEAVGELLQLPEGHPLRDEALEELGRWRIDLLQQERPLTREEQEEIMNTDRAYEEWRTKTLRQGLEQGLEQGEAVARRADIVRVLVSRFGDVPPRLRARVGTLEAGVLSAVFDESLGCPSLDAFDEAIDRLGGGALR